MSTTTGNPEDHYATRAAQRSAGRTAAVVSHLPTDDATRRTRVLTALIGAPVPAGARDAERAPRVPKSRAH